MRGRCFFRSIEMVKEIKVEKKVTKEIKKEIGKILLAEKLKLISKVRGEKYKPRGECPNCGNKLKAIEILAGFRRDPNDFTTKCPKCGYRFEPSVVVFSETGEEMVYKFYCRSQVLPKLESMSDLTPNKIAFLYPDLYRSTIVHWGTIGAAMNKLGKEYKFVEVEDWKKKVLPFLGKMPDSQIAGCVGVCPSTVRKMREKYGVEAYSVKKIAREKGLI